MREQQASLGPLAGAITKFLKVTKSCWAGLFHCYDIADLPRTDNELEQCAGLGALFRATSLRASRGDGRVGGARTGSGRDGSGIAAPVLLTVSIVPERSCRVLHVA